MPGSFLLFSPRLRGEKIVFVVRNDYTGTAVFRFGLKNGNVTTVAVVFIR
jgi:hypothetical protein